MLRRLLKNYSTNDHHSEAGRRTHAAFCFWLEYVSSLVCSPKKLFDYRSLFSNDSKLSAIHGSVVDWSDYSSEMADFVNQYPHQDLSLDFPKFMALSRPTSTTNYDDPVLNICIQDFNKTAQADAWLKYYLTIHPGYDYQNNTLLHCPMPGKPNITGAPCFSTMDGYKTKGVVFYDSINVKRDFNALPSTANSTKQAFVILDGNVLDVSSYLIGVSDVVAVSSQYNTRSFAMDRMFLPLDLTLYLYTHLGKDISDFFKRNLTENPDIYRACITKLFQAGVSYTPLTCSQVNPALWSTMGFGLAYFLIKFNLAQLARIPFLQKTLFSSKPEFSSSFISKSQKWPHVILMVPCFAESSQTLKQTFDNLARSSYDDAKKLLLFVCDGVAINAEAKKETYKLLLESLGHSSYMEEPVARSYTSLGQNTRRINYAKIYSGYYETGRNRVPYLVIVKIGNPKERLQNHPAPPGNRGKRDSLVLVFSFLERCMNLANNLITPLDYEIFNQCYNVLGIDPRYFKYLMLTDADVQVQSNVVHKLVLRLEHDRKMLAVSGHVRPANPEENLTTMIQIFHVYMDFFTGLAYESCLHSVMSFNGGLVMFKIWAENENSSKYGKKQQAAEHHRLDTLIKMPKLSDEIIIINPFDDIHSVNDVDSIAAIKSTVHSTPAKKTAVVKLRPESHLNLFSNSSIQACCVHPTVIRGICTAQPNTMHMQNVLLLGEEKYLSIILLTANPGYQLGFEPEAEGYATLPSSFFSLQGLQTRNIRASFHIQLEMNRVSWRLGFRYWLISSFELIDKIFSLPMTIYLYIIFARSIQGHGTSYTIIACAFCALMVLHMLVFLMRCQVKYILWLSLYCILGAPIYSVWFPLIALWQSDYAGIWYDMWPTASLQPRRARTHGILECEDSLPEEMTTNKESNEEESEVMRLTLSQFDNIEVQRQRQEAEAALDSNFVDFSTDNDNQYKHKLSHRLLNNPEVLTDISSPPLAQVREGLHSTRLAQTHVLTHTNKRNYHRYSKQDTATSKPENIESIAKDPFDDRNAVTNDPLKKFTEIHSYHKPSYSQSSHNTYEANNDTPIEKYNQAQKNHWITEPWETNDMSETNSMILYSDEASLNDRGSILSFISGTFSIDNDHDTVVHQSPLHRLDPSADYSTRYGLPEEGRRRAVHTNINAMSVRDNVCHQNKAHIHKRPMLKYKNSSFDQNTSLNSKPSSSTLTHQLTHSSDTTIEPRELHEMESLIFNEIKNCLQEADLDSATMAEIKEYLIGRYKNKVDFNKELLDFIEKSVRELTWGH
ncbi:hypothetical protein G6F37_009476 [Rhizopus arrhizus]|nr:hypothetical protein G6F38_008990 [Rhizopus arrhizus]KAG1154410.1 hypothetical protein G6F37_009476 [Rhizopus arrhizus]